MPRAGSITAVSYVVNKSSITVAQPDDLYSFVQAKVQIGGVDKITTTIVGSSGGDTTYNTGRTDRRATQSRGTDTFSAGDNLMVKIEITDIVRAITSSVTLTDITCVVECTFDD